MLSTSQSILGSECVIQAWFVEISAIYKHTPFVISIFYYNNVNEPCGVSNLFDEFTSRSVVTSVLTVVWRSSLNFGMLVGHQANKFVFCFRTSIIRLQIGTSMLWLTLVTWDDRVPKTQFFIGSLSKGRLSSRNSTLGLRSRSLSFGPGLVIWKHWLTWLLYIPRFG